MADWALRTICLPRLVCLSNHQNASVICVFILPPFACSFFVVVVIVDDDDIVVGVCVVLLLFYSFYAFLSFLAFVLQSCAQFPFSTRALRKNKEMPPTHPGAFTAPHLHFSRCVSILKLAQYKIVYRPC